MMMRSSDIAILAQTKTFTLRKLCDDGLLGTVLRNDLDDSRLFALDQVPQVYLAKVLQELDVNTGRILQTRESPQQALELFQRCSKRLQDEISLLQEQLDMFDSHANMALEGMRNKPDEISVRHCDERRVYFSALDELKDRRRKEYGRAARAHERIRKHGNPACPLGVSYDGFFDLLERPETPAQLVSYDPQGDDVLPAGDYLIGTTRCFYDEQTDLARRMFDYALQHDLDIGSPAYVVYLHNAATVTNKEDYLLQYSVKVK